MASGEVRISTSKLKTLANAIAEKSTVRTPMTIDEMAGAVASIPSAATLQSNKTVSPSTSQQVVTPDTGYDGLEQVTVNPMPTGSAGIPIAQTGTVSNHSVTITPYVTNSAGYISSAVLTGTPVTITAGDLASGTLYCDDSGNWDVTNAATFVVGAGTEGTPTATKGTVSNHAISVTPKVTNSEGWITGGTKTGTAVSVSASELVSGTYTVNASGTANVTNYASISVSAGSVSTPTASKGTVSNHSVTVTPSVSYSAGYISGGSSSGTAVTVTASELASGDKEITANGTDIDVVGYSTVSVNVPTGGGSSGSELLYAGTIGTYNDYRTTTESTVTTINLGPKAWTSYKSLYVTIYRVTNRGNTAYISSPNDGFLGSETYYPQDTAYNYYFDSDRPQSTTLTSYTRPIKFGNNSVYYYTYTGYGIYPTTFNSSGDLTIAIKYNSSYSGTITGTYNIEAYLLDTPSPLFRHDWSLPESPDWTSLTDLTGTTWEFGEWFDLERSETNITLSLNFTSNGRTYTSFKTVYGYIAQYNTTNVYSSGWSNENYRTVAITGGTGATSSSAINFFIRHATRKS